MFFNNYDIVYFSLLNKDRWLLLVKYVFIENILLSYCFNILEVLIKFVEFKK